MSFKWSCPFCNRGAIITSSNYHRKYTLFSGMVGLDKIVTGAIIECPNPDCYQFTFTIALREDLNPTSSEPLQRRLGNLINEWNLIPASEAKPFPKYIPKPILEDYEEACLIKALSPKASATLARRCMQGIIRDFWKVKKPTLYDEIEAIKNKVEPQTWKAMDSVREVGNIGAHMQQDINLIIEVEPNEAKLLLNLIEILLKDWYINSHERGEKLQEIIELGKKKQAQKKKVKKNIQSTDLT